MQAAAKVVNSEVLEEQDSAAVLTALVAVASDSTSSSDTKRMALQAIKDIARGSPSVPFPLILSTAVELRPGPRDDAAVAF